MPREIVLYQGKRRKIVLTFPWFLLIGWWVGLLVITLAMVLTLTVIGIPHAFALIDQLPAITLRKAPRSGAATYESMKRRLLRAMYFLLIGCWLSSSWIMVAALINYQIIFVGDHIAARMINYVPTMATLASV